VLLHPHVQLVFDHAVWMFRWRLSLAPSTQWFDVRVQGFWLAQGFWRVHLLVRPLAHLWLHQLSVNSLVLEN
jgi:hypothetical protein